MLIYLIFAVVAGIVVIVATAARRHDRSVRKHLVLIGLILFVGGCVFGVFMTDTLVSATAKTHWPFVEGVVTSSKVIGDRAYRPEVKYEYSVDDVKYSGVSTLDDPGFGNRAKRLDVAEKLVAEYPVDETIPVYFNPDKPSESLLVHHVAWNIYMQLTIAVTIALAGALILIFFAYQPQRKESVKQTAHATT